MIFADRSHHVTVIIHLVCTHVHGWSGARGDEIEESICQSANGKHHLVMYYPKYLCELNHIEHFWCSAKKWARENCNYSLEGLRRCVPQALASVSNHTMLAYYHKYGMKIDLYRKGSIMDLFAG